MSQNSSKKTSSLETNGKNRGGDEHNLDKVEVRAINKVSPIGYPENAHSSSSSEGQNGGGQHPTREETFFNHYATKKTVSNGFLDVALLATNVGQLKVLLSNGFIDQKDPKWWVSIVLVSTSIIAQVVMLLILGYLANNNLANRRKKSYINFMNNVALVLTGVVFCLNIITTVFIQIDFTNLTPKTSTLPNLLWSSTEANSIK